MKAATFTKLVAILVAVCLATPTIIVAGTSVASENIIQFPPKGFSLDWYSDVLTSSVWREVAVNSAKVGIISAVISTLVGTALAFGAARGSLFRAPFVASFAMAPVLVPSVVAAIGFYFVYIGSFEAQGDAWTLGVAGATTSVPLTFVYVYTAIRALDDRVEEAAAVCGANAWRRLQKITLPLLLPSILTGALFSFLVSWEEIVVATFLAGPGFLTVPLYIFGQATTTGLQPDTAAASVLLILLSMVLVGLIPWLTGRRAARAG
jgi:putative spermidine/putrescine transport system permease protein